MPRYSTSATIANGATASSAIEVGNTTLVGIQMPSAFTGTTLSIQVSADGTTYVPLYDDTNTAYSFTVAVSRGYSLDVPMLYPWPYMKLVSGSAEGAARTILVTTGDV